MKIPSSSLGLLLALCPLSTTLLGQDIPGAVVDRKSEDPRIMLRYSTFDPLQGVPEVPGTLRSGNDTNLWIVQFHGSPSDDDRQAVRNLGGKLVGSLPEDCQVVRMTAATASAIAVMGQVRWVGAYEPAYRLDPALLAEHLSGRAVPTRTYNLVMADKWKDKQALEDKIIALGGKVVDRHIQGLLFTVELTGQQLLQAARLDEVLWIDQWMAPAEDMHNARAVQGSDIIETAAGFTGTGVRGHVYEGVEATHPDFTTAMTNVRSSGAAQAHGHCTAGIIFGNGNSAPQARGHAPSAVGFYTNYTAVSAGFSRNAVISDVVNVHNCMFTTASWGSGLTTNYTSVSADADDIVFDHRIPWTNSMSNQGNQNVRPEAWAKNVISVGGLFHRNDADPSNDAWSFSGQPFGSASVGPASDGRIKPDLCNFYEDVWTSDLSGSAGYASGNSYTGFNGTSAATPITAGLNALAIQMYTNHIFNNTPRVSGGSRFANRPFAQTLKALQIACASLYPISQATRAQAGWGYGNVGTMYNRRERMMIIPEDVPITQGATQTYQISVLSGETSLKVCMSYLDPQGNPAATLARVNNLNLRVISPFGVSYWGNNGLGASNTSSSGGSANNIDTVENVFLNNPVAGTWTIEITAPTIAQDAHLATAATDATYALVVNGGRQIFGSGCARFIPDTSTTGSGNLIPFGTNNASSLETLFAANNGGSVGGAVYFNLTPAANLYITGFEVNTTVAVDTPIEMDVYTRSGTHVGFEGSRSNWTPRTMGRGVAAAVNTGSLIELNTPILLGPSLTGIALVARNFNHRYTNGTGTNQNYSDTNLTLDLGSATNAPFGSVITPRVANIRVRYRTDTSTWTNQIYQTILRREDLGVSGEINGLAFSSINAGRHFNRELVIRMSHVTAGHTLSTTFSANLPSPVTVLSRWDHNWFLDANSWTEIGFAQPFNYNGTSDVVVEIYARGNHSTNPSAFNSGNSGVARVGAFGFGFASRPTTASFDDNSGLRMRVNRNCAVGTKFGTSCGSMRAEPFGTPNRGGVAWYDLYDALPNAGVILGLGFAPTTFPVSLNQYGFTNCLVFHDLPTTLFFVTNASGQTFHGISVPNSASFDGLKVSGQWFGLDPAAPGGITVSNYITNLIGIDP